MNQSNEMAEAVLSTRGSQPREYPRGSSPEARELFDTYLNDPLPCMQVRNLGPIVAVDDGLLYRGPRLALECTPYYFKPDHYYFPIARHDHLGDRFTRLKRHVRLLAPWKQTYFEGSYHWCTDLYSRAFYHWVAETLPRIFLLRLLHPGGVKIVLPGILSEIPYVRDSLTYFPEVHVTYLSKSKVSRFRDLGWVSPMGEPYQFNPTLMRQLRKHFATLLGSEGCPGWRRTYISRAKANRRVVKNERELEKVLAQFGFETRYMEQLTLKEQMTLCSESQILLGLHGAGLANMLFLPPGAFVIELRRDNGWASCFYRMAHAIAVDYTYCFGRCAPEDEAKNEIFVDMTVDPEELESKLHEVVSLLPKPT
jgi:hypothetical protein